MPSRVVRQGEEWATLDVIKRVGVEYIQDVFSEVWDAVVVSRDYHSYNTKEGQFESMC